MHVKSSGRQHVEISEQKYGEPLWEYIHVIMQFEYIVNIINLWKCILIYLKLNFLRISRKNI